MAKEVGPTGQQREISRFSSSGKTFFFNQAHARNGSPYLAINALYGKGNRERVVLFEPHLLQFRRHRNDAVQEVLGVRIEGIEAPEGPAPRDPLPFECPDCGVDSDYFSLYPGRDEWFITCENCHGVVLTAIRPKSEEGA